MSSTYINSKQATGKVGYKELLDKTREIPLPSNIQHIILYGL